jgi:hypothetical protein
LGLSVAALFSAQAQTSLHARVSFDEGGTLIRGTDDADWSYATINTIVMPGDTLWVRESGTSELEVANGTFLRMADGSKIEIAALPPSTTLRAWTGSFYVQRLTRSSGDVVVRTPSCFITVDPDSCVRVDILGEGATTTSVRWGSASVRVEGGSVQRIGNRQRVYTDPGYLPSNPVAYDMSYEDDFDAWNRERAEVLVVGGSRVPASVPISNTTIGYSELSDYGDWVDVDNRTYWRPTFDVNYVPYRHGHWSYVHNVGHCWVEDYPFGYVTSHHGRWIYLPRYGWVWSYDPQWSPAWVATVRSGPNFMWSPIGYDNRPVLASAVATFDIGGVSFSLGATSWVPQDHLYYGSQYVAPVRPTIVQNINVTNIQIWNIDDRGRSPHVHVPYKNKNINVYNYSPKVVVRGPAKLAKSNVAARDAVTKLEKDRGGREFKMAARTDRGASQTAIEKGARADKSPRTVRLDAEQKQSKPKLTRDERRDRAPAPAQIDEIQGKPKGDPQPRTDRDGRAPKKDTPAAIVEPEAAKPEPDAKRTTSRTRAKSGAELEQNQRIDTPREKTQGQNEKPKANKERNIKQQDNAIREDANRERSTTDREKAKPAPEKKPNPARTVTRDRIESDPPRANTSRTMKSDAERSRQQGKSKPSMTKPSPPASRQSVERSRPQRTPENPARENVPSKEVKPEGKPKTDEPPTVSNSPVDVTTPSPPPQADRDARGRGDGGNRTRDQR